MRMGRMLIVAGLAFVAATAMRVEAQTRPVANLRDPAVRQQFVEQLRNRSQAAKAASWARARQRGWAERGEKDGVVFELMAIENGKVYMYTTANVNAAISTGADLIRNTFPYDVNGAGLTVGIWDGGAVRATHQEFGGRVTVRDGASALDHSTHVGGTIGAAGVVPSALGMAPSVLIDSYDWTNDTAEMAALAMSYSGEPSKIQLSNHSYGYLAGWSWSFSPPRWYGTWGYRESESFGSYDSITRQWDVICYNAPYYLPFKAAGNDRNEIAPSAGATFQYWDDGTGGWATKSYDPATDPYNDGWDNGGYDTIGIVGTAKNVLTVGAVNDAVSGGVRWLANASMAAFSCWGPTDDGRIKPDIVANGVALYSCAATSDTSYLTQSGTSMATPNAAGSATLLCEYYGRLFPGQYMRASTIKGLIIHTADDLDNPGPDYRTGWGLMNVKAAADHLKAYHDLPTAKGVVEALLDGATPTATYRLTWDGYSPIRVTLCWTDPPATEKTGLDDPSPRLVNDLGLRLIGPDGSTTYYPYVLDPANPTAPATTGDNTLDNVEQVCLNSPPAQGVYTVQVAFKGALTNGQQYYSLLMSGQGAGSAGSVAFAQDVYNCASVVGISLTDIDLRDLGTYGLGVTTAGGDSETVTLTETPPGSGSFFVTIATGPAPATAGDGTLQLIHGDTITVTYEDADDGTGDPAVVQATATADCVPPAISNVAVTDVAGSTATVSFHTDEVSSVRIRYGNQCGQLNHTQIGSGAGTSHQVGLSGLTPNTQYYFVVDATDAAGNTGTDDNVGACYDLVTLDQPDYFTELFDANDNDLSHKSFTFRPDGSADYYRACYDAATVFPTDPNGGTAISLNDDHFVQVTLTGGAQVFLYGAAYSDFYVGSNGYVTFTMGDTAFGESLAAHFNRPRISALFDDLNPLAGGTISWKQLADRAVVTYENIREWNTTSSNSFQIEMFFDGRIRITYLDIAATDGLAGLSAGLGQPADFAESNFTNYGSCPNAADFDGDNDVDLDDFSFFRLCYQGPNRPYAPGCEPADLEQDNDVDLVDFALFRQCFNGTNRPPACP